MSASAPTIARTVQRTLELGVPARFATVNLVAARAKLDKDDDQIDEMIDLGRLRFVWNIASPTASKRELRFLWDELTCARNLSLDADEHELAGRLFGEPKPFVDGTNFRRAFNCDSDHVLNLIRAGVLRVLPNTGWRKGPNGTPAIAWASAVKFVKERRL